MHIVQVSFVALLAFWLQGCVTDPDDTLVALDEPTLVDEPTPELELMVYSFDVGATPAMQFPWTLTQSRGLSAQPRQPSNMHVAACAGSAAVAWTSQEVRPYDYQNQWQQSGDTFGHVSWFSWEAGTAEMVANHKMPDCSEMGGINVSPDCSVLSVLCISREGPGHFQHLPGFKDVVSENEDQDGRAPFGWRDVHLQEPDEESAERQILHAYLFEWTLSGVPGSNPDRVSLVNSAIGGWRYGSWSLALSRDKSRYSVSLKTTIYGGGSYHEGAVRFELERDHEGEVSLVQGSNRWACGSGHVQWNVQAYNEARDAFGHWCWTDGPGPSAEWDSFAAWFVDGGSEAKLVSNLPKLSVDAGTNFFMTGGPTDVVSRGSAGWLGVLTSLDAPPSSTAMRLGLADLPGGNVTWLDLARPGESVGWPRLARLGSASEESDRYLLGWADVLPSQDLYPSLRPIRYNVAEVDGTGAILTRHEVNISAWEDVSEWATVPDTGCVVWAHAWNEQDGPLGDYGSWNEGEAHDDLYSSSLRITQYCASPPQQPREASGCTRPGALGPLAGGLALALALCLPARPR